MSGVEGWSGSLVGRGGHGQGEEDLHCHLVVTWSHRGSWLWGLVCLASDFGPRPQICIIAGSIAIVKLLLPFSFQYSFAFFSPRKGEVVES